eukprot:2362662-Alexandrium_andersonii.AAC.1
MVCTAATCIARVVSMSSSTHRAARPHLTGVSARSVVGMLRMSSARPRQQSREGLGAIGR